MLRMYRMLFGGHASIHVAPSIEFIGARYSAFSGIVAQISVGTPPQSVQVSLSMDASRSWLYGPETCPPFVGNCFDPLLSSSYINTEHVETVVDLYGAFTGSAGYDNVLIGSVLVPEVEIMVYNSVSPRIPAMREGAGVLSLSKSSPLMRNRFISFSDEGDSVRVREVYSTQLRHDFFSFETLANYRDKWVVSGGVNINSKPTSNEIEFNMGELDLVFPIAMFRRVGGSRRMDPEGRFLVNCNEALDVSLIFLDATIEPLVIPWNLLALFPESANSEGLCKTRMRFTSNVQRTVIGRIFTRLVGEVVLDYTHERIHVSMESASSVEPFSTPTPLVPVFRMSPDLGTDAEFLKLELLQGPGAGLVAASRNPQSLWFDDERVTKGYVFLKTVPGLDERIPEYPVVVSAGGMSMAMTPDQVVFRYNPGDSDEIVIRDTSTSITVAIVPKTDRSEEFDLPSVCYLDEKEVEDSKCSVCLVDYVQGDSVLCVASCKHMFHKACLSKWLNVPFADTCPECRGKIPRKKSTIDLDG